MFEWQLQKLGDVAEEVRLRNDLDRTCDAFGGLRARLRIARVLSKGVGTHGGRNGGFGGLLWVEVS